MKEGALSFPPNNVDKYSNKSENTFLDSEEQTFHPAVKTKN